MTPKGVVQAVFQILRQRPWLAQGLAGLGLLTLLLHLANSAIFIGQSFGWIAPSK